MGSNHLRDQQIERALAHELVAIRKERNMTQEEVAKSMGIARPTLALMETADRNITLTKVVRYAEALAVDLELKISAKKGKIYLIRRKDGGKITVGFHDPEAGTEVASTEPGVVDNGGSSVDSDPSACTIDEAGSQAEPDVPCEGTPHFSELSLPTGIRP